MLLNIIKAFLRFFNVQPSKSQGCIFSSDMQYNAPSLLDASQSRCPVRAFLLSFFVIAFAYYGTARLGLMLPYKASVVTLLWLPTGIAAGAMMRYGKAGIFATFVAAFFVERAMLLPLNTSLMIAFGNTLAPFIVAYSLHHFQLNTLRFNTQLHQQSDIVLMVIFALLGMTVSALIGVTALYLSGTIDITELAKLWFIWWMGDTIGVLLAMPLVLNLHQQQLRISLPAAFKLIGGLLLFILFEFLILHYAASVNKQFILSVFLILPVLIWVAMQFGVVGGSIVVITLSTVVVWAASVGYGDLYSANVDEGIFSLWLFILSLVIVMLLISTLQVERNAANALLKRNARHLNAIIEGALDGIVTIDSKGNIVEFNPAAERIFGHKKAEVIGQSLAEIIVPPNQRKAHHSKHQEYVATGKKHIFDQRLELTALRKNGTEFPVELTITALKDDADIHNQALVTGFIRDISTQKQAQQEIEKMLFYDMLTGLANRRLLIERFQRAALNKSRIGNHFALMFIDLDHFKLLNDTKGHDAGDLLLKELARHLLTTLRASDTLARLSGDEFVVVLENLDTNEALAKNQIVEIAQKILSVIHRPFNLNGFSFNTTGSIGITLIADDSLTFEDHLRHADTAMYLAKARGRNTYCFYDASTQTVIDRQLAIESALKDALHRNELTLYYQSIVDTTEKIVAAEALLRWQSHVLGTVSPGEFIPVAEKSGQIIAIGDWVLRQACLQLKAWQDHAKFKHLILSVNISAKQLLRDNFVSCLQQLIAHYNVNPDLLKLELTETAAIGHIDEAIAKFKQIRAMGVRIALDDFGAGQSSLIHIKKLPVSQLKIDLSFVADMLTDSNDAAIIQMIIAIGNTIGCHVVAEGVETRAQFKALQQSGCKLFQGYYFSKPVPIAAFEAILNKTKTRA